MIHTYLLTYDVFCPREAFVWGGGNVLPSVKYCVDVFSEIHSAASDQAECGKVRCSSQ